MNRVLLGWTCRAPVLYGLGLDGADHANWPLTTSFVWPKWLGRTMNVPIDRKSPVPLARQIQAQLERLIREGVLAPGLKLRASRDLARTLGVNRATVVLAYEELVAAGWARSHVGQGTFVLESVRPRPSAAPAAPARASRDGNGHGPTHAPSTWAAFFC